jgi:uncharacterized protein YjiS (DUF1127 family)
MTSTAVRTRSRAQAGLPQLTRIVSAAVRALAVARARHRSRQALTRLDAHLLRDIGLTDSAVRAECAKAPWQD